MITPFNMAEENKAGFGTGENGNAYYVDPYKTNERTCVQITNPVINECLEYVEDCAKLHGLHGHIRLSSNVQDLTLTSLKDGKIQAFVECSDGTSVRIPTEQLASEEKITFSTTPDSGLNVFQMSEEEIVNYLNSVNAIEIL